LADKISSQFSLSIVVTGTAGETNIVQKLKDLAQVPVTNLAGCTTLRQLVALLKFARIVVANDTGPGHIAAALGTPLVLIFGHSNPARVGPYKRPDCVAAVEPEARGLQIKSEDPRHDIRHIAVDDVFERVCRQIKA
jgi:ADP-heptose:LPS heptosyltransferase